MKGKDQIDPWFSKIPHDFTKYETNAKETLLVQAPKRKGNVT